MRRTTKPALDKPYRVYLYNAILTSWHASAMFDSTDAAMAWAREQLVLCAGRVTRAKVIRVSDFLTMDTLEG